MRNNMIQLQKLNTKPELLISRHNWTRTYPVAACFSTASSDHHRAKMDNSISDGRGDAVECTRQAGSPVAGEGRIPGMPEVSSTSATSSAAPAGLLCDGVAPNACPQLGGTLFTLPGNKRVAVGAPDARWEEATLDSRFISVPSLMPWVLVWALTTAIS